MYAVSARAVAVDGVGFPPLTLATNGWSYWEATQPPAPGPAVRRPVYYPPPPPPINMAGSAMGGGGGIVGGWWMPDRSPKVVMTSDGYEVWSRDEAPPETAWGGAEPRGASPFGARQGVRNFAANIPVATQTSVDDLLERLFAARVPVGLTTVTKQTGLAASDDTAYAHLRIALVEITLPSGAVGRAIALAQGMSFALLGHDPSVVTGSHKLRLLAPPDPVAAQSNPSLVQSVRDWWERQRTEARAAEYEHRLAQQAAVIAEQATRIAALEDEIGSLRTIAAVPVPQWSVPALSSPAAPLALPPRHRLTLKLLLLVALPVLALAAFCWWLARPRPEAREKRRP